MKVKEIFNNNVANKIDKFLYQENANVRLKKQAIVTCFDELTCENISEDGVELKFIRELSISGWFAIEMHIRLKRFYKNKEIIKGLDIKKWIEEMNAQEKTELGANVFAVSSLLIAQMTNLSVNNPLIVPCQFQEKHSEESD